MRDNAVVQQPGPGSEQSAQVPNPAVKAAPIRILALVIGMVFAIGIGGLTVVRLDDNDGGDRRARVAAAADATMSAGSSKVALDIKTDAAEGNRPTHVEINGVGSFDYTAGEGHIDEHLSGATVPPGVPVDVSLLITRSAVYVSGPAVASALSAGKTFLKLPVPPRSVVPNANTTPAETLKILKNVSGPIVKVKKERVRGVGTVHY